jgi:hypothetical protein
MGKPMKPSDRISEIFEIEMTRIKSKPDGDWPFMMDEEKMNLILGKRIEAIEVYLNEQAKKDTPDA